MKIVETVGCIAGSITVDDADVNDMTTEEYAVFIDKVLAKVREKAIADSIPTGNILKLLEYDEYEEDEEPCEQCGDSVSKTTWII